MKTHGFKSAAAIFCAAALVLLTTACTESRSSMSKTLFIANETNSELISLTLDAQDPSLEAPIELLDSPLAPGAVREIVISLPEKQAKNSEWSVRPVTEDGADSSEFTFGELNPHADNPVQGFYIQWFDDHYGAGVALMPRADYIGTNPYLYAEDDETSLPESDMKIESDPEGESESPLPDSSENGPLAVDEKYLTEGNANYGYIVFYADGSAYVEAVNGELAGYYTVEGWTVSTRLDNGESENDYVFTIVDENTLELPNGDYAPTRYIREGSL